jgi:glutaconate CoA-transferase subunit B
MTQAPIDELMAIALARQVRDGDFVSHGSAVPLAGAALMLAKELHAPNVNFFYDGAITPAETNLARLVLEPDLAQRTASAFFSQAQIVDFELRGGCDLQFLRPAQIDRHGNVNVSLVGTLAEPRYRFHGIAVADAMTVVKRLCLYVTEHSARVFPSELDFKTGVGHDGADRWRDALVVPGGGPAAVVTPLAVLGFDGPGRSMSVTSLMPGATVDDVRSATGFELEVDDGVSEMEAPTDAELDALRAVDPLATRRLEFRDWREEARRRIEEARGAV